MRVAFLHSDKAREALLADAFLLGASKHGARTLALPLSEAGEPGAYDVACMVGVKSRELFQKHRAAGVRVVYLDKGYSRQKRTDGVAGWEYWRVSLDSHHPTARLAVQDLPDDRWRALGLEPQPWRKRGSSILIAGSSAKYHEFYGLKEPTTFAKGIVRELLPLTRKDLVYRPKPSWREAVPIPKARFSTLPESIGDALAGAFAMVTHGSNACFEAVLAGIPVVTVGPAVAAPISSSSLAEIGSPRLASDKERERWFANLAYWQWTQAEMASGAAWAFIREELHV